MIRERCSCGAEFETDLRAEQGDTVPASVREWRVEHPHRHRFSEDAEGIGYVHGASSPAHELKQVNLKDGKQ
jgi:hypothetical protein